MIKDIKDVGTDIAEIWIFDPNLIGHLIGSQNIGSTIDKEAGDTGFIVFQPGGDGSADYRFYIDEEVKEHMPDNAFIDSVGEGYLRVPSGRLFITGAEDVIHADANKITYENLKPKMGGEIEVSNGIYRVKGWQVDWEAHFVDTIDKAVREQYPNESKFYSVLEKLAKLVLGLSIFGILVMGIALVKTKWVLLLMSFSALLVVWGIYWLVGKMPAWFSKRYRDMFKFKDEFTNKIAPVNHPEPPHMIFHLNKVESPDEEKIRGFVFGHKKSVST
jgi:hypothetical protein